MLRFLPVLLVTLSLSCFAAPDAGVATLLTQLPDHVQGNRSLMLELTDQLEETAELHPDLLFFHYHYILALYDANGSAETKTYFETQYKRQRSIYLKARRGWILTQLLEQEKRPLSDKKAALVHDMYLEIRSQRYVNFPEPKATA